MYPFYLLVIATAPGLIWLFYFLRKDAHPEPRKMILVVFFLGMLSALLAAGLEILFQHLPIGDIIFAGGPQSYIFIFLQIVFGVALVEEALKYAVVRLKVLRNSALDEPIDVLLYMIIAALGFATMENILIFLSPEMFFYTIEETLTLAAFRFISATFLHALVSGTVGFFLALSFCKIKFKRQLFFLGFAIAVLLHGLYNFSIMNLEGQLRFGVPLIIIAGLAIFIYFGIRHLKNIKSICKIN